MSEALWTPAERMGEPGNLIPWTLESLFSKRLLEA